MTPWFGAAYLRRGAGAVKRLTPARPGLVEDRSRIGSKRSRRSPDAIREQPAVMLDSPRAAVPPGCAHARHVTPRPCAARADRAGGVQLAFAAGLGQSRGVRFGIRFGPEESAAALEGHLIIMLSTNEGKEPRFLINGGPSTQQAFGIDVAGLNAGQAAAIDESALGYPLESPADVPGGTYTVQPLLHRYETFHRSDGHTGQAAHGPRRRTATEPRARHPLMRGTGPGQGSPACHRVVPESLPGLASGCHNLAIARLKGDGVEKDGRRARTLFQKACDMVIWGTKTAATARRSTGAGPQDGALKGRPCAGHGELTATLTWSLPEPRHPVRVSAALGEALAVGPLSRAEQWLLPRSPSPKRASSLPSQGALAYAPVRGTRTESAIGYSIDARWTVVWRGAARIGSSPTITSLRRHPCHKHSIPEG